MGARTRSTCAMELARIVLSLDLAANCATAFVGDCTSNFARFVVTYVTGRVLTRAVVILAR